MKVILNDFRWREVLVAEAGWSGKRRIPGDRKDLTLSLTDPGRGQSNLTDIRFMGNFPYDDRSQSRQEPVDHSRTG